MPRSTYFNLSERKRSAVYSTLLAEFRKKSIKEVTVKNIVEKLNIPRGSFYQYFYSLHEAYFFVLSSEIRELHYMFLAELKDCKGDVYKALKNFASVAISEIYDKQKYDLYKNRYLYFDTATERDWQAYRKNRPTGEINADYEKLIFIGTIMHSLIQRLFANNWKKEEFLEKYNAYAKWIYGGIENVSSNGINI